MMRRAMVLLLSLALLPFLVTCVAPTVTQQGQPSPRDIIADNVAVMDGTTALLRFSPPLAYFFWRSQVEQCSGVLREGIPSLWIAPIVELNAKGAIGMYIRDQRRIVFALGAETVAWVVRHEFLHDLLNITQGDTHPAEYFGEKCGALVYPPPQEQGK